MVSDREQWRRFQVFADKSAAQASDNYIALSAVRNRVTVSLLSDTRLRDRLNYSVTELVELVLKTGYSAALAARERPK